MCLLLARFMAHPSCSLVQKSTGIARLYSTKEYYIACCCTLQPIWLPCLCSQGIDWNQTIDFMRSKILFHNRTRRVMKGFREKCLGKSIESTCNLKDKLLRMIKTISGVGTEYVNLWYLY